MEIQEIEITIDKNGQVVLRVRGAKGMVCQDITKDLEKALGGEVLDRQFTPESLEKPDTPIGPGIEIKAGK
jgi:Protein of unknown function (DUF2997)